ncbi:MAG TPA: ClpXP protease specificity-enhancing factor [Burkholderiaceae bacterium]|nr:ClpXP protease specificity-enhancing factor [Burkholderiaceae bacterium]
MSQDESTPSTRPYLIRALHEWCTDNGFAPYLAVQVDGSVQVPREFVKNNEIVLNVSFDATSGLKLGNDYVEFKARFGGVARDIIVPISHVVAIYARENGQGMAFPPPPTAVLQASPAAVGPRSADAAPASDEGKALQLIKGDDGGVSDTVEDDTPPPAPSTGSGRPALKRVK